MLLWRARTAKAVATAAPQPRSGCCASCCDWPPDVPKWLRRTGRHPESAYARPRPRSALRGCADSRRSRLAAVGQGPVLANGSLGAAQLGSIRSPVAVRWRRLQQRDLLGSELAGVGEVPPRSKTACLGVWCACLTSSVGVWLRAAHGVACRKARRATRPGQVDNGRTMHSQSDKCLPPTLDAPPQRPQAGACPCLLRNVA